MKNIENVENSENELPKRKRKIIKRVYGPDIKYKGVLSYRGLRIVGWIFFALAQLAMVFSVAKLLHPENTELLENLGDIASMFSAIPLPLFLLANFAIIIQSRNMLKKKLITFAAIMLGIWAGANIVILHFLGGIMMKDGTPFPDAINEITEMFKGNSMLFKINVFVDLFLFMCVYFFMNYQPKKHFQGKKIYIFRAMILLPILYDVVALVLKICHFHEIINVPFYLITLFPTKPPLLFLAFVLIVLILKINEYRTIKKGIDSEKYLEYLKSRRSSLYFSIIVSVIFFIIFIIDTVGLFIFMMKGYAATGDIETGLMLGLDNASKSTIGDSLGVILVIPFVMLFSYNKTHENTKIDSFIPFMGIGLTLLVMLEGLYIVLLTL